MTAEDPGTVRARATYEMAMERARGTAGHFSPGYGTKDLTPDEELATFMDQGETPKTLEEIHEMYRQGLTQNQIGLVMYPKREQLYKSGRPEPKAFIQKANALARRQGIKDSGTLEAVAPPPEGMTDAQ